MIIEETINREAGDKAKGPRLQRLRCVSLVLDAIKNAENPHIYAAVEHKDDVFIKDASKSSDYLEQNKNFDEATTFTFNSAPVLNTMVGFCDLWVEYIVKSKEVFLGFYTTRKVGKEYKTTEIKSLGIELPDKSILELLKNYELDHPNLLPCVKALILSEYKKQNSGKKGQGNIKNLEAFTDEDWKTFLKSIDWKFEEIDEEELQKQVIQKIKDCKYYSVTALSGTEETILRNLLDLLDERQCIPDLLGRFVNTSDIKLIFYQVGGGQIQTKKDDPVYELWSKLPSPTDKRNLPDKIQAVCASFDTARKKQLVRRTAMSRVLQDANTADKSFLSLRYRIFDKCEEALLEYLKNIKVENLNSSDEVMKVFNLLFDVARKHIQTVSLDFKYSFSSDTVIEGIVLELFDSCFLALD
ncbi:hypothetical protein FAM09_07070 [Niastella caeni]|uniref:DUF4297 domain-containing protein n=1 Tax=Niastella caeni TaxID=2569763 RepID=A0A4S8I3V6_9BACT|nr:hypothetical protein [Niastella caeni]THU41854.1 hypothetical protein FAM09_07070 [Niastella caeni]